MINKISTFFFLLVLFTAFIFFACKKEDDFDTDSNIKLAFSVDTLIFDTVFTTIGSTTQILKIYNNHSNSIKVSSIRLAGGENSQYSLNINGVAQNNAYNVELDPDDSLYIFVRVTVDPSNQNSPLIVKDSILFETNGNQQDIDLVAWGQDAHYFVGKPLPGFRYPYVIVANEGENITWTNDKPYVIYGYVVVDSSAKLNIEAGVSLHFHKNSGLWIYKFGSIEVNGTAESPVTFQGDRLEMAYDELPGQWDRILIYGGGTNKINHAVIKNAFIGVQADNQYGDPNSSLELTNTVIRNMSGYGLFSLLYQIKAGNCVVGDCGNNTLFIGLGGDYDFRHCTFANYWNNSVRIDPSIYISNYIFADIDNDGDLDQPLSDLQLYFGNCVLDGGLDEELILAGDNAVEFNYLFDNCLLRTQLNISDPVFFNSCYKNGEPGFVNTEANDYRPDTLSFLIDKGQMNIINTSVLNIQNDLEGKSRIGDAGPELGAYEFVPGQGSYASKRNYSDFRFRRKQKN